MLGSRFFHAAVLAAVFVAMPRVASTQAIRPGFNAQSDGRNDDGTYTGPSGCSEAGSATSFAVCPGTPIAIGFSANFFGTLFNSVYLNTNGNVTLNGPLNTYTPFGLTAAGAPPILAPFFGDVDTRNPGSNIVTFGNGIVGGRPAFGFEWPGVGYYGNHADALNFFQLVLIDRTNTGAGNFDFEFNYGDMSWETGDASLGSGGHGGLCAAAGYSNGLSGDANRSFEISGSHVCGALIDGGVDALNTHRLNSEVAGRYLFSVRDGAVVTTPEPSTSLLVVTGLVATAMAARRRRRGSETPDQAKKMA